MTALLPELAEQLPHTVSVMQPGTTLAVVHDDALRVTELPGEPVRLVANLPYNVSVPVLLHLLERFPSLRSGIVMVQAEVGHRLAAEPGSKVYGAPSVKAAWYGGWRIAGQVSRMVRMLLALADEPASSHEADALAVAICHAMTPPLARMAS